MVCKRGGALSVILVSLKQYKKRGVNSKFTHQSSPTGYNNNNKEPKPKTTCLMSRAAKIVQKPARKTAASAVALVDAKAAARAARCTN
ncbi:Hypothetical predicted protein [Cloeon dipterum]|uniref:Uncharacterized protein n=1 Tax=Cloeon dipterum TaxID=197152 RepID=A0A8S1BXJ9_9INSE|nr:Hypothetical predicted protein [Cloeon dipterum]